MGLWRTPVVLLSNRKVHGYFKAFRNGSAIRHKRLLRQSQRANPMPGAVLTRFMKRKSVPGPFLIDRMRYVAALKI
jgi:hypothetical protein